MKMLRVLAPLLLAALAGCAGVSGAPGPRVQPAPAVSRTVEQDGKFLAFVGPRSQHAEPFLGVPGTNIYALRSWVDQRNGESTHQLYVADSYAGDERDWNAARDGSGKALRFVAISKNEIICERGCSYAEEFAAALPETLLRASPQGLAVTFAARSGAQKKLTVSGELIQKQLAAVNDARASRPAAAAAPPR